MGKSVLKNAFISVDDVDISDHISQVTIETTRAEVDVTSMGAVNREMVAGLGDCTITATVFQDMDAGSIDETMFPLSTSDTPFAVVVRKENAPAAAGNPEYSMQALLYNYSPIAGGVGEALSTTLTFRNSSQQGLTRSIVPGP